MKNPAAYIQDLAEHKLKHNMGWCRGGIMSQHSDEPQPGVSSDSFWEPGNYKRTAKRIEDGYRLCNDLAAMISERAEMEKTYAKGLRGWAKKWSDFIEKGPEYGTMEAAWKGVLVESDRLCDLHLKIRDSLCNDAVQSIRNWQKDTYHKSMIQIKERKEMEEAFRKAQKPWCKLLTRVERARTEYHAACKQQRTAINQEKNAAGDTSLSPDQVKKMQERVTKSKEDVARWREKYEAALKEIDAYNSRYMEDMGVVFDRCQAMEAQRLQFFKQTLFSVHRCLNVSQDPVLPQIYDEFHHTINNADHQKDLKWWSNNHGVNMAMNWPQFEPPLLKDDDEKSVLSVTDGKSCATGCFQRVKLLPSSTRNAIEDARYALPSFSLPRLRGGDSSNKESRVWATKVAPSIDTISAGVDSGFLEYTEEFREIAKGKSKESLPAGPITLINQRPVGEDLHSTQDIGVYTLKKKELPPVNSKSSAPKAIPVSATLTNNKDKTEKNDTNSTPAADKKPTISSPQKTITNGTGPARTAATTSTATTVTTTTPTATANSNNKENPFDEEEWDEDGVDGNVEPLTDTGEPGVPVRALYDYQGAESDELSFRQGELFEKLEDEDEQGWCKGRKDGRVGLYPANYVEPVGH